MRLAENVQEHENLQDAYSSLPDSAWGPSAAESFAAAFFGRLEALGTFSLAS